MKVALRPVADADSAQILMWRNAPQVAQYMYSDHKISADEHARWFASLASRTDCGYWIIEVEGKGIGVANLVGIDATHSRASWAFYIGDPDVRGGGIGTAVEYLVLAHVFETLKLNRLMCEVLIGNEAVWQMHMKLGFIKEGVLRKHAFKNGAFEDVVTLAMLHDDWLEARPALLKRLQEKGISVQHD